MSEHQRIFYLDALKAFAMMLVVLGHLSYFSPFQDTIYGPVVGVFHMPLFMAISGFFTNPEGPHLHKRLKMLIPFFIFGLGWSLLRHFTILQFLNSEPKLGYWFLYVLVVYCWLIALCDRMPIRLEYGMLIIQMFLMGLHFACHHTLVASTLSTDHMFQLWPFFCLGILLRRGLLKRLLAKEKIVYAISLLMVVAVQMGGGLCSSETIRGYLNDFCAVFIVTVLFMLFSKMEKSNINNQVVSLIGKSTLQIYVLHYFILYLTKVWAGQNIELSMPLNIVLCPIYSVVICLVCVLISILLHKVHFGWVFGR